MYPSQRPVSVSFRANRIRSGPHRGMMYAIYPSACTFTITDQGMRAAPWTISSSITYQDKRDATPTSQGDSISAATQALLAFSIRFRTPGSSRSKCTPVRPPVVVRDRATHHHHVSTVPPIGLRASLMVLLPSTSVQRRDRPAPGPERGCSLLVGLPCRERAGVLFEIFAGLRDGDCEEVVDG